MLLVGAALVVLVVVLSVLETPGISAARVVSAVSVLVAGSVRKRVAEMKGTEVVTPSVVVNWPSRGPIMTRGTNFLSVVVGAGLLT